MLEDGFQLFRTQWLGKANGSLSHSEAAVYKFPTIPNSMARQRFVGYFSGFAIVLASFQLFRTQWLGKAVKVTGITPDGKVKFPTIPNSMAR